MSRGCGGIQEGVVVSRWCGWWCPGVGGGVGWVVVSRGRGSLPPDQDIHPSPPAPDHLPPVTMWPIPWCIWCHLPPLNRVSVTRMWKHSLRSLRYAGGNYWKPRLNSLLGFCPTIRRMLAIEKWVNCIFVSFNFHTKTNKDCGAILTEDGLRRHFFSYVAKTVDLLSNVDHPFAALPNNPEELPKIIFNPRQIMNKKIFSPPIYIVFAIVAIWYRKQLVDFNFPGELE